MVQWCDAGRRGRGAHSFIRHARLAHALNDAFPLGEVDGIVSLHTCAIGGDGEARSERKSRLDRLTRLIQPTELRQSRSKPEMREGMISTANISRSVWSTIMRRISRMKRPRMPKLQVRAFTKARIIFGRLGNGGGGGYLIRFNPISPRDTGCRRPQYDLSCAGAAPASCRAESLPSR